MVVDSHGQVSLGIVLTYHVLVEEVADLPRSRQFLGLRQVVFCLALLAVV